jgi:hypothetical protein
LPPAKPLATISNSCSGDIRVSLRLVIPFSILLAVGCASPAGAPSAQEQGAPRRDSRVITVDELTSAPETDLYSAIQRLRPAFFQTRGITSPGVGTAPEMIQVYVDGSRAGGVDALRSLRTLDVKEVRRLDAGEATQRYGTGNTMGAIVVTRK